MGFDPRIIRYRGLPVDCRYENIKAPHLRPFIRVQYLDEFECGTYGPYQIIFDLYNTKNPKESKPQAFANLTYEQVLKLIKELCKAVLVANRHVKPADLMRLIGSQIHPWWVRNISKIDRRVLVEG